MSMSSEERKQLLNQLAEGKITASQAADLINGSKKDKPAQGEISQPIRSSQTIEVTKQDIINMEQQDSKGSRPTWFHVRVSDQKSGKNRVTVNIPLRLIRPKRNPLQQYGQSPHALRFRKVPRPKYNL